ncbi:MAG TPA: glycosyltransferase family 2 protein [Verrucomicrobiae bacterium]|nr:glycosyltransferase family 2 protein [Verrucomicrobiae bacterium]
MTSNEPLVSVIIPTKNSESTLEDCLKSIKKQSYKSLEIIVVDNSSKDNTKVIAEKYGKVYEKGPERSAQRNFGVSQSSGEYVLIIDSDMVLSENVIKSCVNTIRDQANYKGLIIPEESFGKGFWAQCKKLERSYYVGVDWIEAARFFQRSVYEEMNGYNEEITGAEDVDLPQRIQEKYGNNSIGRVNDFIFHNEQKISLLKTCLKKYYYSKKLDKYAKIAANKRNFAKQSNVIGRFILFFSNPAKLFKNPLVGLGMIFMKLMEFSFGAVGYVSEKLKNYRS